MNTLRNVVAAVLRFIAVGLVLVGVTLFVLAYAARQQGEDAVLQWVLGGVGFVVGVIVMVISSPLAKALTQDYE